MPPSQNAPRAPSRARPEHAHVNVFAKRAGARRMRRPGARQPDKNSLCPSD